MSTVLLTAMPLPPGAGNPPTLPPGVQPPPPPGTPDDGHGHAGMVLRNIAIFGAIGVAAGVGASLLGLPLIGGIVAPMAGLIGGAIGALIGVVKGFANARTHDHGTALPPPPPGFGYRSLLPPPLPTTILRRV